MTLQEVDFIADHILDLVAEMNATRSMQRTEELLKEIADIRLSLDEESFRIVGHWIDLKVAAAEINGLRSGVAFPSNAFDENGEYLFISERN